MFLAASHIALANLTGAPELELKGSEAHDLAVPLSKVAGLYNMTVDPRLEAYGMLVIACVSVYGPKIMNIRQRARVQASQARAAKTGQPSPIVTKPPPGQTTETPPVAEGQVIFPKLQ